MSKWRGIRSERLQVFEHKRILLKQAEEELEARARALVEREREVSAAEHKVVALEAERDALGRRLEMIEEKSASHKTPGWGRKYDDDLGYQ